MIHEDFLNESRIIPLFDTINSNTLINVMLRMAYLDSIDDRPIQLLINSEGGSVVDGLAIIDYMNNKIKSPIIGVVAGMAASMSAIIFLSCNKRIMLPSSVLMLHGIQISLGASIPFTNLKERITYTQKLEEDIKNIITSNSSLTIDEVMEIMKSERYITANEALEKKMCDEIALIDKHGVTK